MADVTTTLEGGRYVIERLEAKRSSTLIQAGALLVAALGVALAALLQAPINHQRRDLQLVLQSNVYEGLPPTYAFIGAVGGPVRAIVADLLWIYSENLKQRGEYFQSHQLSKWICTLQPRFPDVWVFQAWNMSYNISVGTHSPQARWQWVYNGIRLLRDEGIPNNERVVDLYHQLAWIWFHKVGDRLDDYHWTYKRQWAANMEFLLGPPPAGVSDPEAIDWFRPIAGAPRTLDALVKARPGVKPLVDQLDGLDVDVEAGTSSSRLYHPLELQFFRPYTAYRMHKRLAPLRSAAAESDESADEKPDEEAVERERRIGEWVEAAPKEDLDALLAFLRAKVLREQYKMDPQFMLDLTARLGTDEPIPLDWRTPWALSIYWAMYGTDKGREVRTLDEFNLVNTDRIMLFSLATLAKAGRYVFRLDLDDPMNDSYIGQLPDSRFIEAMHRKYLELGERYAEPGDPENTAGDALRSGHVNSLHSAIVALWYSGQKQQAQEYFDYLAKNYKDPNTHKTKDIYLQGVEPFVESELVEGKDVYNETIYLLFSLLHSGYISLANGWSQDYSGAVQQAQEVYRIYQTDKIEDVEDRRALPAFAHLRAQALHGYMTGSQPLEFKSIVWHREQDEVKQRLYDDMHDLLEALCRHEGLDLAKAFPEPAGMEQYRLHPQPLFPKPPSEKADEVEKQEP